MEQKKFSDYKKIFDNFPQAVIIFDINGYVVDLNDRIWDWLQYKVEDVKGMHLKDIPFISDEDKKTAIEILKKRLTGEVISTYEMNFWAKDGSAIVALINANLILDENGKSEFDIVVAENITKEKIIENRYKNIFEFSDEAIMTLDQTTGKFSSGNPATIKMFNAKDEKDFISHSPWDYSPEYQPDKKLSKVKAIEMINEALKNGRTSFEWLHQRLGGEEFFCIVSLNKIKVGGNEFIQSTVRDISKQKKQEEEINIKQKRLEDVNKFMVGRELKMIELKEENLKLKEQLEKLRKE